MSKRTPSPANNQPGANVGNLTAITGLGIAGLSIYWYATFSGPLLWFVDLQVMLFDTYWEPGAILAMAAVAFAVMGCAGALIEKVAPHIPQQYSEPLVWLLFLPQLAGLLLAAWQLWDRADRMPRYEDPLVVIDLDRHEGPLPSVHVRIIGVGDRSRQVFTSWTMGRRMYTAWSLHVPLVGRNQVGRVDAPVTLVADSSFSRERDDANGIPDNPEGLLIADGYDNRTIYRARREGMRLEDHPAVLFTGAGADPMDLYIIAGCLIGLVLLMTVPYPFVIARERRERRVKEAQAAAAQEKAARHSHEQREALRREAVRMQKVPPPQPAQPKTTQASAESRTMTVGGVRIRLPDRKE